MTLAVTTQEVTTPTRTTQIRRTTLRKKVIMIDHLLFSLWSQGKLWWGWRGREGVFKGSQGRSESQAVKIQVWGMGGDGGRGRRLHQPRRWKWNGTGNSLKTEKQVQYNYLQFVILHKWLNILRFEQLAVEPSPPSTLPNPKKFQVKRFKVRSVAF